MDNDDDCIGPTGSLLSPALLSSPASFSDASAQQPIPFSPFEPTFAPSSTSDATSAITLPIVQTTVTKRPKTSHCLVSARAGRKVDLNDTYKLSLIQHKNEYWKRKWY